MYIYLYRYIDHALHAHTGPTHLLCILYIYIYIVGYVWYVGYCDAPLGCVCRYVGA